MCCRLAEKYGRWPHEVADLPFHYYVALRNEYLIQIKREIEAHEKALAEARGEGGKNVLGEDADVDIDAQFGLDKR